MQRHRRVDGGKVRQMVDDQSYREVSMLLGRDGSTTVRSGKKYLNNSDCQLAWTETCV